MEDSRTRIAQEYNDLLDSIRKLIMSNQDALDKGIAQNKLEQRDRQIMNNTITRLIRLRRITLKEYCEFLHENRNLKTEDEAEHINCSSRG